jgi:PEGA domain-containing protein
METIDFLNPKERRKHAIMLMIGYVLIGLAILMITTIFVFFASGFNYTNGKVVEDGMVYLSSNPNPAQIYVNGLPYGSTTNTRILFQAGTYTFKLERTGYRSWQRTVVIPGGQIVYYEYPFLFPDSLTTSTIKDYTSPPSLVSQSLDQHWLVVSQPGSISSFDLYDLTSQPLVSTTISLPSNLLTTPTGTETMQAVAWSNDNSHLLLKHTYDGKVEYILLDISSPTQSVNLTETLSLPTTNIDVQLSNEQSNQYLILNTATQTLYQASLGTPQLQPYMSKVLAYKSYGSNTLLYVTPDATNSAKVDVDLYDGSHTYTIRHDAANTNYLLNLTTYSGDLYVAIAASSENTAYIYEDPVSQITNQQIGVAVPIEVFSITNPNYVAFSSNAQYILFENGAHFAVYDIENQQGYTYTSPSPLDSPQAHVTWMDGAELIYVSAGQLVSADYDGNNRQTLVTADPSYVPYFDSNYKYLFTLVRSTSNPSHELLTQTPLLTTADL